MSRRYFAQENFDENEDFEGVDVTHAMEDEELQVMEQEGVDIATDINAETAEAERMLDVADSLEDIAVVADGVEEATPAEAALIQIAGDIATAGDDEVTAEDVVPTTESFVGRRIATEGIVEKAKQIWAGIKKFLKEIWGKIEKFFYKIFGAVPRLRKQVEALRKRHDKVRDDGLTVGKDNKTFELTTGLENLRSGTVVQKDWSGVSKALDASKNAFTTIFVAKDVAKAGEKIATAINDFDPTSGTAALESLASINDKVKATLDAIKLGSTITGTRFGNDYTVTGVQNLLGGKSLISRVRTSASGTQKTPLTMAENIRSTRVEFTTLESKTPKTPDSIKFTTMNGGDIDKALDSAEEVLNILEKFHRGSARKDMLKAAKDIEKACDKVEGNINKIDEDAKDHDSLTAATRAVYKFNMTYASIVSAATTQGYQLGLSNVRTVLMLVTKSLAQYKKAD